MNEITNDTSWLVSVLHDEHGQIVLDKVNSTREAVYKFIEVIDDYKSLDVITDCLWEKYERLFNRTVKGTTNEIMSMIDNDYSMTYISDDNFRLKVSDEEPIGENRDICMYGWCYGNIFFAARPLFD